VKPMIENRAASEPDVVLVGAGIMSASLGVFLKELEPALNISMVETLDGAALESSDAWNNAGTGHAANCELNYTPERSDGSIDISKAAKFVYLGASGGSTAVFIAIGVLEKCFKNELTANRWLPKLKEMIPSYGESLIEDAALSRRIRADTAAVLHLENV
jgi:L-2-hydroxyglutarate oxidase LhgO